jgi:hypothetical protein
MGEIYSGRRGGLGIGIENTRGTAVLPQYAIPYNELSFDNKATKQEIGGAVGNIQTARENVTIKKFSEGSFSADLDDKAIGAILASVFGQLPSTTGSTNYTHTFSVKNSNIHQTLTLLVQDPNVAAKFALGMISSLEITIESEGKVTYTAEFIGKAGEGVEAETLTYTELGNHFLHSDVATKIAADVSGLSSAVALDVVSLTLKIIKNTEEIKLHGSLDVQEIINKDFTVEGSIVLNYTDNTFRDYDINGSNKAIRIALIKGTDNALTFTIPKATFEGWEPSKGLEDAVTQSLTFKGVWSISAGIISAELKNQVDEYVAGDES